MNANNRFIMRGKIFEFILKFFGSRLRGGGILFRLLLHGIELWRIDGKAIDNQTIAGFMRELEQSDYVKTVDLGETRQSDERGAKIKAFSLSAVVQYAGGAKASTIATTEQVEKK